MTRNVLPNAAPENQALGLSCSYLQCAFAHILLVLRPMSMLSDCPNSKTRIAQILLQSPKSPWCSYRVTSSCPKVSRSYRNVQWYAEYVQVGRPTKCKVRSALTVSQRRDMRSLWVLETESGAQCGRWKVRGDRWEAVTAVWGFIWLRPFPSRSWPTLHLGY